MSCSAVTDPGCSQRLSERTRYSIIKGKGTMLQWEDFTHPIYGVGGFHKELVLYMLSVKFNCITTKLKNIILECVPSWRIQRVTCILYDMVDFPSE